MNANTVNHHTIFCFLTTRHQVSAVKTLARVLNLVFGFLSPQVKKVNLSKKESLTIMGHGGSAPELLANETLMREGQVIRSTTNQVYIHYRSLQQTNHGMFSLHYQGK